MRNIIVISMITLDGVMQAPGGPKEDTSGNFKYGGWTAPYGDDLSSKTFEADMRQTDYLLGRKTFAMWADYWPQHNEMWPAINAGMKYVLSTTMNESDWENSAFLKHIDDIMKLKNSDGPDLQVWGSSQLVQLLLEHDLIDELRLRIFPITLGQGKKLLDKGAIPAAFKLTEGFSTPSGIIIANYKRAGEVKTGTVGA